MRIRKEKRWGQIGLVTFRPKKSTDKITKWNVNRTYTKDFEQWVSIDKIEGSIKPNQLFDIVCNLVNLTEGKSYTQLKKILRSK